LLGALFTFGHGHEDHEIAENHESIIHDEAYSDIIWCVMTTSKKLSGTMPHRIPEDLKRAVNSDARAHALWEDITPLARNEWICWVISAKKKETRERRIKVGLDKMRKGMRRPCCWAGCPHR